MKWIRTCSECGNEQEDKQPKDEISDAYRNRLCKSCKSPGLDYGSFMDKEPNQSWDDYYAEHPDEDFEHDDFPSDHEL